MAEELVPFKPTKAVEYNIADARIEELKSMYSNLKGDTPVGYKQVTAAIATIRDHRVDVEKMRKQLKADALEFGRVVDAEAKRVTLLLEEIEEPLKAEKKRIDDEKERIKREAEEAERRKLEEELRKKREEEEALLKAEREKEAARIKAEQDAREAKLAEERRAFEADREKMRIEREKLEADRKEAEAKAAAERQAEEARLRAEREKEEAARREVEEKERTAKAQALADAQRKIAAEQEELRKQREEIRLREEAIRKEEEARQEAIEKARLEAKRRELLPDLERVAAWGGYIATNLIDPPHLSDSELQAFVNDRYEAIDSICREIIKKGEA